MLTSASTAKTLASSWSLPLRTPLSRSSRTSVRDAYLGHLRVIGARALVHEETHTRKLEYRAWEGRLVGYLSLIHI